MLWGCYRDAMEVLIDVAILHGPGGTAKLHCKGAAHTVTNKSDCHGKPD